MRTLLGKMIVTRQLVGGVVFEHTTVLCRRKNLKRLLEVRPDLDSYSQSYDPDFNVLVLTQDPLKAGYSIDPGRLTKEQKDHAEWEALLDEAVKVTSKQGRG